MKLEQSDLWNRRIERIEKAQKTKSRKALCVVVVETLDLTTYIEGLFAFLNHVVKKGHGSAWLSNFTKTIFFSGRIERNFIETMFDVKTESAAWMLIDEDMTLQKVSGMLTPLTLSSKTIPDQTVAISKNAKREVTLIFVRGMLPLHSYLINITHLFAEAFIAGELDGVGRIHFKNIDEPLATLPSDLGCRSISTENLQTADMVLRYC